MIPVDPAYGNPTLYHNTNLSALATNHFLDTATPLELLQEFTGRAAAYAAHLMREAGNDPAATARVNEVMAVLNGANRALQMRRTITGLIVDIDAHQVEPSTDAN